MLLGTVDVSQKQSQQYDETLLNVGLDAGDALTVAGSKTTIEPQQPPMDESAVKEKLRENIDVPTETTDSDQAKNDDIPSHLESKNVFQGTGCDKGIIDKMPETDSGPQSFETAQLAQNEDTSKLCITEMDQESHPPDAANSLKITAEIEDPLNQEVRHKEGEPVQEELQNTTEDIESAEFTPLIRYSDVRSQDDFEEAFSGVPRDSSGREVDLNPYATTSSALAKKLLAMLKARARAADEARRKAAEDNRRRTPEASL